ncbi:alpha-2-macroglobulin family protein [Thiopseudomonas denitrificans]|uniref:alpha-2-macroglobulin family protein n=1 Tax=Thiopseudomonas denitrificans TaxID=1501432 RepID=UPI001F0C0DF4|nr:alpha-2-macroglobulin [Thiopseudomonas denitrificans]
MVIVVPSAKEAAMHNTRTSRILLHFLAILLFGSLLACNQETPDKKAATGTAVVTASATDTRPDPAHYQGQPLTLVDVSEQQVDGAATLVLSFSVPLQPGQAFAEFISINDLTAATVLEPAWVLSDDGMELRQRHLPPKHRLNIEVQAGLLAITGTRLQQDNQTRLTTNNMEPMLGFASKGSLLPIELAQGLPVQSLNVNEVDVDFFRIHDTSVPGFIARHDSSGFSVWNNDDLQAMGRLVYSGRFDLQGEDNVQQRSLLPVNDIEALQQPGVYFAVMRQAGNFAYTQPATLFTLSDIGLSAHRSAQALDLFALGIADGKSLTGISIQLLDARGQLLDEGSTDHKGHLQLPLHKDATLALARSGRQTSFLPLKRGALDLSEFAGLDGAAQRPMQLFVFGPRDLYRPGETVLLNALLRDADGQPLPEQPVQARILTPDGQELRSFAWQPQETGFYQYRLQLADSAPTGRWQLVVDLDGSQGINQVRHEFQVEDFMPERMALELSGSTQPLTPDAALDIQVEGRFLYGAPAAGSEVQGQLFVRPLREALPVLPGYQFGSVTEKLPTQSLDFKAVLTDDKGHANLQMKSQWDEARSPLELVARVSLMESGGRPITRRHLQAVWPASQLVGIRGHYTSDNRVDENSLASFSLVLANAAGELQAADNLQVRLIRERRDYYWSYSAETGWRSRYSEKNLTLQQRQISLDGKTPAQIEFPVQWGSYRIEVENPQTGLVSSERFWAGYRWQDSSEDGGVRPDQVRLKLDRAAYRNGETAKVRIEAPHAGSGYVLVESADGPLWWQNIEVPADGLDIRIPVDKDWKRHDLYVTALVVRSGAHNAEQTAKRAVGVLHLPLDRSKHALQLELEAPDSTRPGREQLVRIKVRDADGKVPAGSRVLLSAVDVGVLNITGFKTPDPLDSFFGRKAYAVDQLDVYGQLIDAGKAGLARLRFGGDAALEQGGDRPKSHVQIVAWQSDVLTVDADGYAETRLPLPEFNGQLRLMAQAWDDDRFASSEQLMTVAAPLVAELAMPRFLARGDDSQLMLELHNLTDQPQSLQLKLDTGDLLELSDTLPDPLPLAAGQRQRLPLPVRAIATGTSQLALRVDGLQLPDETLPALQRQWQLDVRSPWPDQSRRVTRLLQPGEHWSSADDWLDGWLPGSTRARLTLSTQPMTSLATLVRSLYEYPYGCSEQTASRLLPLLYLPAERLSELLDKPVSTEQRRQLLQSGIEHLLSMQRPDGSFAMWDANGEEIPWNTVLATDFLQQASRQGLEVSAARLDKARERLLRYVREGYLVSYQYTDDVAHSRLATQSYAAYVLSQQQPVPLSALRTLYNRAADAKTPLALVHLAVALDKSGDGQRSQQLLQKAGLFQRDRHLWVQDYGSPLSDLAWQIHALNSNGLLPDTQLGPRLEQLVDAIHGKRWLSTQENAAAFMALHSAGLGSSEPWQASLQTASRVLELSAKQPSRNLGSADLRQPLTVTNDSEHALYQVLNARGNPEHYSPQPDNVLKVGRDYFNLDGSPAQLGQLASGDLLLVRLQISASETVRDALVVDLLPAGFELENQNLGESSVLLSDVSTFKGWQTQMQETRIAMQSWLDDRYVAAVEAGPWQATTLLYLVRAVTPGEYQLPPVQVQSMYRPDWQAEYRGDDDRVVIR